VSAARAVEKHPSRSRREIERHLDDLARLHGWRHHRTIGAITPEGYHDGFPGEVLIRDGHLLLLTIADEASPLTGPECEWLEELRQTRKVDVRILRPADLDSLTRELRLGGGEA
jgi:hypothetical protein